MAVSPVFTSSESNFETLPEKIVALLDKACRGDEGAFSQLYQAYFEKIYKFLYYRVNHKETAEDLTEDVFIKAYQNITNLQNVNLFEGWLFQIARNRLIDHYRSKKQTVDLDEVIEILEYEDTTVDVLDLESKQKILLELLKELTTEQRQVIRLKFFEDLSNSEIASLINKTEVAVRVIQHRAMARLKELISNLTKKQ